ncbi:hypothetical protein LguiB_015056 [Lonicera macranthoides]
MSMISIFIVLLSLYNYVVHSIPPPYSSFSKIQLPPRLLGPEAVALDPRGGGPYVAVIDGRILKWQGTEFVDFATTSPRRTTQLCDRTTDPDLGPICGRPIAFSFHTITGDLYITDAYLGVHVVGPNGGHATPLATGAEGIPFRFCNGIDVDQLTGNVYFADGSTTFELRNITQPSFVADISGRLLRYNPRTREVKVLLRGLATAVGPAVSLDSSFLVVSELRAQRIQRFWLRGPRANTAEIFLNVQGNPNKIKRNPFGEFWVALNYQYRQPVVVNVPQGVKFNALGTMLQTVDFGTQYVNTTIQVVQEQGGALYVGSRIVNFVGVYM